MDENAFFRDVTVRICGDLDLKAAFQSAFERIREAIPASAATLNVFQRDLGAIRVVAWAPPDEQSHPAAVPIAALSGRARESLDDLSRFPVRIVNRMDQDLVSNEVATRVHAQRPTSLLIMKLAINGERLGALVLRADGNDRYTEDHARLLAQLHDPFAIALSNAMRFEELTRLRDLLADDNRDLQRQLRRRSAGEEVIGADFGLREVMELVRSVAPSTSPVLLLGETGTGKEVIAEVIHQWSPRASGPMVRVNCGALAETLIDSELFGHEKGAFTGATVQNRGRFERANGGTIFLDEIGELPLDAQARLLRVLQGGSFERVGGSATLKTDVRVVGATNRDLRAMVRDGRFREDLWFRLAVFPIRIPPLRERTSDIPALAYHFLERKAREMNLANRPELAPGAIDQLTDYDWPGNVRELQNVIERALLIARGRPLSFDDLRRLDAPATSAAASQGSDRALATAEQVLADHIRSVLEKTGGRIEGEGGAAELLGMNASTLRHRLRKLGIPFGRKPVAQ